MSIRLQMLQESINSSLKVILAPATNQGGVWTGPTTHLPQVREVLTAAFTVGQLSSTWTRWWKKTARWRWRFVLCAVFRLVLLSAFNRKQILLLLQFYIYFKVKLLQKVYFLSSTYLVLVSAGLLWFLNSGGGASKGLNGPEYHSDGKANDCVCSGLYFLVRNNKMSRWAKVEVRKGEWSER